MRQPTTPQVYRYLVVVRYYRQPYRPVGCYRHRRMALNTARTHRVAGARLVHVRVIPWG